MSVVFDINEGNIRKKLETCGDRAMRAVAEQLHADAQQQYVKVNTGTMQGNMGVEQEKSGQWVCYTEAVYARYQYYFPNVGHGSKQNPKATSMWYHKCYDENKARYQKQAQKAFEMGDG